MAIFDLAGKISLDSAPFMRGLKDGEAGMKDFQDKISSAFSNIKKVAATLFSAAIVKEGIDAIKGLASETATAGDAIDKQSQQLGLSRKAYQEWEYILSQSGASIDSMGAAMRTLSEAYNSSDAEMKMAFSDLNLSTQELKNMKPEDALEKVVRAFQKMPPSASKSRLAVKLFGRSGQQLMPLLNSSETSIDEFRGAMEELGLYMSDDAVDASVAYGDALDTMKRTFNSVKYSIGSKVLPVLTNAFQKITGYAGRIKKAYEENGLKGVFDTLVTDIKGIQWPTWDDVKKAAQNAWGTIVNGVKTLGKIVFGENVDGTIDWPTWEEVGEAIGAAWQGIVDGVKNLGTTIGKVVFGENVDGTVKWPTWEEIGTFVENAWRDIVNGVKGLGTGIGKAVFGENVDGTIKWPKWSDIESGVTSAWNEIVAKAAALQTVVFGDASTAGEMFDKAREAWENLRSTIEGKAIEIGKYFFGDANGEQVADAIKKIMDVLIAFGTGFMVYKVVGGISQITKAVQSLLTFDFKGSKTGAILAAIATAFTLIVENWDTIKPALEEAVGWLKENVFEPVSGFIKTYITDPIETVVNGAKKVLRELGIISGEEGKTLSSGQIGDLKKTLKTGDTKRFVDDFTREMTDAGFTLEEINNLLEVFSKFNYNPELINTTLDDLGKTETAIDAIKVAAEAASGVYPIEFPVTVGEMPESPAPTINSGTGPRRNRTVSGTADESSVQGSFASGLWEVPYDDFPAMLHEGEMVLTRSQARDYRDGERGQNINISALVSGIISAVKEGMRDAQVNAYLDGRRVTRETNRITADELKNMRFAR